MKREIWNLAAFFPFVQSIDCNAAAALPRQSISG